MENNLKRLRLDRGLTLAEVAASARPRTTAQTIGRLENGTRTLSVPWLMRLAPALGVDPAALIGGGAAESGTLTLTATLTSDGVKAARERSLRAPSPGDATLAIEVEASVGDYRAGDRIWLRRLDPERFGQALNRDVLVPRGGGRWAFGRLIAAEGDRLQIVPPRAGARQVVATRPEWIGLATTLVRHFD